jgi:hypothetical protein
MQTLARTIVGSIISGSIATAVTTVALGLLARAEGIGAFQPTNSTSHWLHGDSAGTVKKVDIAHSAVGYTTHHASAVFWAFPFEWRLAQSPQEPTTARLARDASIMAAIAAFVDYGLVPKRLTPGWETVLSKRSIAATYVALAAGLTVGALVNQRLFTDDSRSI